MHRNNLTTLFVLPIAFALLLSALPGDAEAQVCVILKSKPERIKNTECVVPSDIKNESLTGRQVRDLAKGFSFRRGGGSFVLPRPGLVIINAIASIDASGSKGPVSMLCTIGAGPSGQKPQFHDIFESLNPAEGVKFASVVATRAYKAKKGRFVVSFNCNRDGASISKKRVSVRYVPTEY